MLPTFLVIGAAKAGSTSLYRFLNSHPQVFMSECKEPDFFIDEVNWKLGLDWYESHFDQAKGALAIGEASVRYSMDPLFEGVPGRVAQMIPEVKLVYLVRDPIERMLSHYIHRYRRKPKKSPGSGPIEREHRPIQDALLEEPHYINSSRYAHQVELYLQHFAREQLLIITSEELRRNRMATLRKVYEFLGIDPSLDRSDDVSDVNVTASKRKLRWSWAVELMNTSVGRTVVPFVPDSLKSVFEKILREDVDVSRARIPDGFHCHLEELLRDDVRRLRTYMSADFDGWGIA